MSAAKIVKAIEAKAGASSTGQCGKVVREALESALSITIERTEHAKDYGPKLVAAGFTELASDAKLAAGDVRVIQSCTGHPHGHLQVYTGSKWLSDFKQTDEWPGSVYRTEKPSHRDYRYSK